MATLNSSFNTSTAPTAFISTLKGAKQDSDAGTRLVVFQVISYIIDVLIILGNSFVIWLIVRTKSLYTVTNMLLVSLAISDLLVGLAVIPSFMACIHVSCDLILAKMAYDYFLFVSVANLCAITIDRYTAVMHPLRYPRKMTPVMAMRIIAISWVIPAILSILPVCWTYSNTSQENHDVANKVFYTIQVIFFVFIPCCLMLWAYSKIFHEAIKQTRRIHAELGNVASSTPNGTVSSGEARNAIKVFGTIVCFFVLCWSLSAYRTFVIFFKLGTISPTLTMISRILLIANSAVNPVFYTLWKKDVRREVGRLVMGSRSNAVHPATSASNPSFNITQQAATLGN